MGYWVPLNKMNPVLQHLLALPYLAALLYALLCIARAAVRLPVSLFFRITVGVLLAFPSLFALAATLTPYKQFFALLDSSLPIVLKPVVYNLLGPIGLSLLGSAIGRVLKHPNTLLVASAFAIFFDIVVVTMGTVAQLMNSGSNLIASVSVGAGASASGSQAALASIRLPQPPPPLSGVTIGPADVLFIAVFLSSVALLKLAERGTFRWMFVLLMIALAIAETSFLPSWLPGVPALVPMGIAVLVANRRFAAFTRDEKYAIVYGTGFALLCAAGIIFGSRSLFAAPPRLGMQLSLAGRRGPVFLSEVAAGSAADKAGLKKGDILLVLDGTAAPLLSEDQLTEAAKKATSKEGVVARIWRRGEANPRQVTLNIVK